jgi:hypothetical protein
MGQTDRSLLDRSREIHNATIDERTALAGLCGMTHLPSGRTCTLPAGHPGGCAFALTGRITPPGAQRLPIGQR